PKGSAGDSLDLTLLSGHPNRAQRPNQCRQPYDINQNHLRLQLSSTLTLHNMIQRAGVALSRIADNAPISITHVDGAPYFGTFSVPTESNIDNSSVEAIVDTITRLVGFDTTPADNEFAIAFPIAVSKDQWSTFKKKKMYSHDHCTAFLNGYASGAPDKGDINGLFIDLTPGQVAATLVNGGIRDKKWYFTGSGGGRVVLGDISELSIQTVMDKLVIPVVPEHIHPYCIGILRPEGAFPNLSSNELEARFPDTPVKWVSLNDISHGSAILMNRKVTSVDDSGGVEYSWLPLGVTLANGQIVTILPGDQRLPTDRKVILSTSQDNQTTATLRFSIGTIPWGEVVLEGLSPKAKGEGRIKLTIDCNHSGGTAVVVEEVGSTVQKTLRLKNIVEISSADAKAYKADTANKQVEQTLGADGVIGELPE
ncbi:15658_t:CDS:2, partial [Acaulospora colombiana]